MTYGTSRLLIGVWGGGFMGKDEEKILLCKEGGDGVTT